MARKGKLQDGRAVSVGTTATLLSDADSGWIERLFTNVGSASVYIGNENVTTATGTPIAAGGSFAEAIFSGRVYGIVASGTEEVRVMEVGGE